MQLKAPRWPPQPTVTPLFYCNFVSPQYRYDESENNGYHIWQLHYTEVALPIVAINDYITLPFDLALASVLLRPCSSVPTTAAATTTTTTTMMF
jgi:hypothetical protein